MVYSIRLVFISVALVLSAALPAEAAGIEVHVIDVGVGDAICLRFADNSTVLIDAGDKDHGQTVVDYLKARGISSIDLFLVTHMHYDHVDGAPAVLDGLPVQKVLDNGGWRPLDYALALLRAKDKYGTELLQAAGQTFDFGDARLKVLETIPWITFDENSRCVVTQLDAEGVRFLFAADAVFCQELRLQGLEDVDILKVAHHGSFMATSKHFLEVVKPEAAIISTAAMPFGILPSSQTLGRLSEAGATVYVTGRDGTILVNIANSAYTIHGAGK
jgi:competence protein ComEC